MDSVVDVERLRALPDQELREANMLLSNTRIEGAHYSGHSLTVIRDEINRRERDRIVTVDESEPLSLATMQRATQILRTQTYVNPPVILSTPPDEDLLPQIGPIDTRAGAVIPPRWQQMLHDNEATEPDPQFSEVYEMRRQAEIMSGLRENDKHGLLNPKQEEKVMGVKKYTEQTLHDIKLKDGSFFLDKKYKPLPDASDEENKTQVTKTLDYIETVAQSLNIPVTGIKMIGSFTEGDRLITDEGVINEKLFKLSENLISPEWRAKSMMKISDTLAKSFASGIHDSIDSKKATQVNNIRIYQNKVEAAIGVLRDINTKYGDVAEGRMERIQEQVVSTLGAISDNPFYTFIGFDNREMRFLTQPIELRDVNPAANLDLSVNLGSVVVTIPFSCDGDSISVTRGENNIDSSYWHPHVSCSGDICWGNAATLYQDLLTIGDIGQLLTIIQQLLCTYNRESPYLSLATFAEKDKDRERGETLGRVSKGISVTEEELSKWDAEIRGKGEVVNQVTQDMLDDWYDNLSFNQRPLLRVKNLYMRNREGQEDKFKNGAVLYIASNSYSAEQFDKEGQSLGRFQRCSIKPVNGKNEYGDWDAESSYHAFPEMLEVVVTELESHPLYIQ